MIDDDEDEEHAPLGEGSDAAHALAALRTIEPETMITCPHCGSRFVHKVATR